MKMKKRRKEVRDGDAVMKTCLQNLSSIQKPREPKRTMSEKALLVRCLSFFTSRAILHSFPLCSLYREASPVRPLVIQLPLVVGQWKTPEKKGERMKGQWGCFFPLFPFAGAPSGYPSTKDHTHGKVALSSSLPLPISGDPYFLLLQAWLWLALENLLIVGFPYTWHIFACSPYIQLFLNCSYLSAS